MIMPGNRGSRIKKYNGTMNGIDASANSRPNVNGTPKIGKPSSMANKRPQKRPGAVAERDGHTVITVTSFNCEGATPAIG